MSGINLAPEIIQVFANSQIFHDHKPLKIKPSSPPAATFGPVKIDRSNNDSEKLLERLEEGNESF